MIQSINKNIVSFNGNIDDPISIMKNYDSIIVLGTHQGSPNVVLEAASVKLPCIANDSGGTKEILNTDTGILLPSIPEVEPLFEALNYTINNYKIISEKAENAFNFINSNFSMDTMMNKYLKVIYD
jgi:glycosyltransferase involved in cell wall biosynthesis